MSETVTDIVSKDRLTKAHPWEMSRLRTPFTWTIAKATKQTPAWSSPTIPSAGPAPQFNMTPLVTSAAPKSNLDPAPNPVNDPEQQPIHPPMDDASLVDDDSILIPHVNTEPEPRIAPKQKASILNDSLSPTKPGHKKMVLANDFAGTMAEATFHVSSFLVGGPSFFTETLSAGVVIFVPGNHHPRSELITLPPGIPTRITTAIRIRVVPGLYLQLALRSSQAAQGITVLGGIIDPDYTGHLHVYLINLTHQVQHWSKNRAIAQLLVHRQVFLNMLPNGPATRMENATPAAGYRGTRCEGSSNTEGS
ncbi:hypothetical protein TCAL_14047 [Tigriopus californicus]|uniref:Deoxyuridine 5'-triphosphate nucleotidohydrolase n=1 Tax=Tigriopus californicus TaxID=6832 RepID=A0A553P650_TIGCA|nr:hypothetical protein TCAL_14047 [Tigriopus californicus]